jgi:two-component system, NarL family, sensor histidine kinase DegS
MKKKPVRSADAGNLRRRALRQLGRQPVKPPSKAPANTARLLQELQIQQIELELQNEELRQSMAQVEAGLEKYSDLYDLAPVGYFSLDEQGKIMEVNLTGAGYLGKGRAQLIGRRFQLFVAPSSRPAFLVFQNRIFMGHELQSCEIALLSTRQPTPWVELQAISAFTEDQEQKWSRVAAIDITARQQAKETQLHNDILIATNRTLEAEIIRRQAVEAALSKSEQRTRTLLKRAQQLQRELRTISHQVLQVQETQRKEISRRLHDEISQLLLGINVHLTIFSKAATANPGNVRQTIVPLRNLVEESLRVVHRFARELRPAMLDDLGLIPALRSYIDDFPRRQDQQIHFSATPEVEALDNDKRTMLYRVAQEALTNVAKHSNASEVNVLIGKIPDGVSLEIIDNGTAFNPRLIKSPKWNNHLGLIGMRERVEMVGGRFSIKSVKGEGTSIKAEIPFETRPGQQ